MGEAATDGAGDTAALRTAAGVFGLFAATVLGGVAMAQPFLGAGLRQFSDPADPANAGLIIVEILVATLLLLAAFRYGRGELLIRVVVIGVFVFAFYRVTAVALALAGATAWVRPVALAVGLLAGLLLWGYPEWYVVDAAAVVAGATFVALFGISLGPLPVVVLLVGMAAYDAYSVYVSEHMQSLGGGILDLKLPMVFVVPPTLGFSLREVDSLAELPERGVAVLGLGDAFFPGILAVSGATFVDAPPVVFGLNLPGLGTLLGGLAGMVGLLVLVHRIERAHAGLPPLNAGVLLGYLAGAALAGVPVVEALGLGPYL